MIGLGRNLCIFQEKEKHCEKSATRILLIEMIWKEEVKKDLEGCSED